MEDIEPKKYKIVISIVSHGQGNIVAKLLETIALYCDYSKLAVVLTVNIFEELNFKVEDLPFKMHIIFNDLPKGFGTNHNQAFKIYYGKYFCVLNPDVVFDHDPFPYLTKQLHNEQIGIIGPAVYSAKGVLEDSARKIPTPWRIFKRSLLNDRQPDYLSTNELVDVDWVAGMFMLFRQEDYRRLRGFNEKYYLYLEDVDICARMWLMGKKVIWAQNENIIHNAHRSSHHNYKYLKWHFNSLIRYFVSKEFFQVLWQNLFR